MPAGRSTTSGVERLWRREGLKVPAKQPKRGRLWLNDGSCIRLRADGPDHVWSYDFVHHRTYDGRAFRMLNVLDEFTRESLAIRVRRKLSSIDVIDVLTDLFIPARHSGVHPLRQRPGVRRRGRAALDRCGGVPHRLHRAGLTLGERLYRELQCAATRRAPERGNLLHPQGSPGSHRIVAVPLQRDPPTWQPGLPAAGAGDGRHAKLAARLRYAPPAAQLGRKTGNALTFNLDQSTGAGQYRQERPSGSGGGVGGTRSSTGAGRSSPASGTSRSGWRESISLYVLAGLMAVMWALLPDVNHMTRDGHIPRWTLRTALLRLLRCRWVLALLLI